MDARLILVLSYIISPGFSEKVTAEWTSTVKFGQDASLTCSLSESDGVSQVTWQKLVKDKSDETLATVSKRFGANVMDPHVHRINFTNTSLNPTSIIIKNVTPADEACYMCSFNVYPKGSSRKQLCLKVQGIFKEEAWETPTNKNSSEVVVSCTGTGKPAPEIKWGATDAVPKEQRIPNDDGTVTVVSNITLHLSECSGSDVICTLSNSVETKTLTVPLCRKPPEEKSSSTWIVGVVVIIIITIIIIIVAVIAFRLKRKKDTCGDFSPNGKEHQAWRYGCLTGHMKEKEEGSCC
ncbi:hypothetical protein AGOR_G00218960 [Albula goreensis]|uniref:Ig-like domain-containing protein n=1 Tax=Albula goreensis TaxID=1534307 RepID=A0A8T3CJT1_9TELE|nr:hypothetical protein AGOR_G00218960 [Albula goreensis]